MSEIVSYPDHLPKPHFDTSGIKQTSNLLRTEMASGRKRQRPKFYSVPAEQTLIWRLSADDASKFLGWVQYVLFQGARWFKINQRTELGVVSVDIRMTQHPLENATKSGGKFVYTVKCEVKEYPVQSQEKTLLEVWSPVTLDEISTGVSSIGTSMNSYYTESWNNG